ncbi:MAG: IS21-like element helper ATPase IstB [Desulfosporosinus sp.]
MLTSQIAECCKELRLSRNIADMSCIVQEENNQQYLLKLLKSELEHREITRTDRLIKNAGFYTLKAFESFRFDEVTLPAAITVDSLKKLEFIDRQENLVLYGNVGTGKTHLSIALGIEACKKKLNVQFFRTSALVNKLAEAKKNGTLSVLMKKLSKGDLLIFDEWGYVPLDRMGAQLLFEIVSECYERKPLIINTNIEFSRWVNVFYDEQMTSAIIDRLLHHCHLLMFPGPSNRMRESGLNQ